MRGDFPAQPIVWLIAILLLVGGTAYLIKGASLSWTVGMDGDLQKLRTEYSLFQKGIYPHRLVAEASGFKGVTTYAIYPPHTFTMLAPVFWPHSLEGARVVFQVLTAAALSLLMWYGARRLSFAGRSAALLGAAIPYAITGNCSALAQGQFSIICVAFLALQILLLQRKRSALAGICWAFAMFKPHVGITFALLFFVGSNWRGLFSGGLALLALTAFALLWTQVHPVDFWVYGVASHQLNFMEGFQYGLSLWSARLGLNIQLALLIGLLAIGASSVALLLHPFARSRLTVENAAAAAAVLSLTLLYHRHYDNLLFIFVLLPLVAAAFRQKSRPLAGISALVALTVYTPTSLLARLTQTFPATEWIIFALPIASCLALLLATRLRPARSPTP